MGDTVSCRHLENYQVHIRTANHALTADLTRENGGDGLGPNPFELLLSSLGACAVITVVHYAAASKIPLEGVWADLNGERHDEKGAYHVALTLRVRGNLSETDLKRLAAYARRCHVHQALSPSVAIEVDVQRT